MPDSTPAWVQFARDRRNSDRRTLEGVRHVFSRTPPRSLADLVGWTPFQIEPRPDNILVHWIHLGEAAFAEPFFGQTIQNCMDDPALGDLKQRVVTTPITALTEVAKLAEAVPPGAFLFHCARAGSTLLANAFRALPGTIVLAEPQPFNQLMGAPHRHQEDGPWPAWLKDLLACLGQPRQAGDRLSVVKFNSLTTLEGGRLTKVFPEVPALFLYRHPLEVMVSALESPPIWLKLRDDPEGAARRLGLPQETVQDVSPEDFCGLALKQLFEAALAQGNWHMLNYEDLTPETIPAIAEALAIPADGLAPGALQAVFQRDAKSLEGAAFTADAAQKRQEASPAVQAACRAHLEAAFAALEARRLHPS